MITPNQLQQISEVASQNPLSEATVTELRSTFPEVHFTYCMDDDVGAARPVLEEEAFNLYLIDGREHCLCFTEDMNIASGVVVAEIEDD